MLVQLARLAQQLGYGWRCIGYNRGGRCKAERITGLFITRNQFIRLVNLVDDQFYRVNAVVHLSK